MTPTSSFLVDFRDPKPSRAHEATLRLLREACEIDPVMVRVNGEQFDYVSVSKVENLLRKCSLYQLENAAVQKTLDMSSTEDSKFHDKEQSSRQTNPSHPRVRQNRTTRGAKDSANPYYDTVNHQQIKSRGMAQSSDGIQANFDNAAPRYNRFGNWESANVPIAQRSVGRLVTNAASLTVQNEAGTPALSPARSPASAASPISSVMTPSLSQQSSPDPIYVVPSGRPGSSSVANAHHRGQYRDRPHDRSRARRKTSDDDQKRSQRIESRRESAPERVVRSREPSDVLSGWVKDEELVIDVESTENVEAENIFEWQV